MEQTELFTTTITGVDRDHALARFGPPAARNSDPHTSHDAARFTAPRANTNRALALRALAAEPHGLTDFELAEVTGLQQTSIGKRRGELRDGGFVQDSGERRRAPSGTPAIVWEITQAGREALSGL